MQGYRTLIVAGVLFVAPALARWGFNIDANLIAEYPSAEDRLAA